MLERAVDEGMRHVGHLLPKMSRYAWLHSEAIVGAALVGLRDAGWRLEPPHRDEFAPGKEGY